MTIAILPLVVAVLGALGYALSTNGKAAELSRLAFFAGLLVLLLCATGLLPVLRG